MREKLKPFVLSLGLISVIASPVFAATGNTNSDAKTTQNKTSVKTSVGETTPTGNSGPDSIITGQQNAEASLQYFPIDIDVPGQSFVSSGPYIGIPLVYSGGNLIINSPNINEDVTLLNMRKNINRRMHELGRTEAEDHAHLLLSGIVEGQALYKDPGVGPNSSDIDLTSAELDGYILAPSHWTSALFSFAYDNDRGTDEGSLNNNSRPTNSRLFVNKAFIVLGDFEKSPVYASFGQMYVPFGTYSSNMVSSPLTKLLGRTKERALVLGFQQQGANAVYGAGYTFRGDTYVGSTQRISNGGFNLGYRFSRGKISGDVGGGMIANLADSQGMQNNGNPLPFFGGFGAGSGGGFEQISHRIPAVNLRGLLSIGSSIDLLAEYISAVNSFSTSDMTFNSHGAKPQALNVEGAYTFTAFDKPSSVAIGYAKSKDALALGLAAQRYSVVFNTSWWKDTLQSLEVRHDINYAAGNTATGTGAAVTSVINGSGRPDNMVTAQFDLYF